MFAAPQAPFFHFATPIDLPQLDEPFVDHILATMADATQRRPDRHEMLAAFNDLHRNPYYFRMLVETMLLNPRLATETALHDIGSRRNSATKTPGSRCRRCSEPSPRRYSNTPNHSANRPATQWLTSWTMECLPTAVYKPPYEDCNDSVSRTAKAAAGG